MTDDVFDCYSIDQPLSKEEQHLIESLRAGEAGARFLRSMDQAGLKLLTSENGALFLQTEDTDHESFSQLVERELVPLIQQSQDTEGSAALTLCLRVCFSLQVSKYHPHILASTNVLRSGIVKSIYLNTVLSYEDALAAHERTLGPKHPDTLNYISGIARCFLSVDFAREALPHFKDVFEVRERTFGPENRETLSSINNLATCLQVLGRSLEALPYFQRVLTACEQTLGREHRDTLTNTLNLAACLDSLGRAGDALPFHQHALVACSNTLGPEHRYTILCINNLAGCLRVLGQANEALSLYQLALAASERTLGAEHSRTLGTIDNIAGCLQTLDRTGEALPVLQRALETRERTLGAEHPDTLTSFNNFAQCLLSLGRAADALPLCRRALEAQERSLGLEHRDTIVNVTILANCLHSLGRSHEALVFYRRALEALERNLGPEHPDTLAGVYGLASCLESLGKDEEALPHLKRALNAFEHIRGPDHRHTLTIVTKLAACLRNLHRAAEAVSYDLRALEGRERELGLEHPDTLSSVSNLALCLKALGRVSDALAYYRRAAEVRERTLGREHPDTLTSVNNLAVCLESLDQMSEALRHWLGLVQATRRHAQPGTQWLQVIENTATALATHARAGLLGEWVQPFAALSTSLLQAIDLESAEQLEASRADVNRFFSTYLDLCIDLNRLDIIPTVLAARQGRKLAAWTLEELEAQGASLDSASLRGRFQALRLELRRLAIGLHSMESDAGIARNFAADRAQLNAESLITAQRTQLDAYSEKLAEYETLRAELAKTDPDFAVTARSLQAPLSELQTRLDVGEGLILLFERGEAESETTTKRLALLITADGATLIPLSDDALQQASQFAQHWSRALYARRGMRRGVSLDDDAPATADEDAVKVTPLEALRTALQAGLWAPLTQCLNAQSLTHLHLVTHGSWHVLPVQLGAPESLTLFTYPGFIYYHRLRHQSAADESVVQAATPPAAAGVMSLPNSPLAPHAGSALGLCMHAAENDPELAIPFVRTEGDIIQALWPGTVHTDADLKRATPRVWALQYAAHGQVDKRDAARASLLLGSGNLDLHALLTARQHPAVVVLSACTVGRTSDDPDGEPLGLVGGFLLKNTRYVIASLQPVPDFYMPLFMALFHEGWCAGAAPDVALAEAKRRFARGEWLKHTEALVRRHYAPVFAKVLERALTTTRHEEKLDPLLMLTWVWPFPQDYRKLQPHDAKVLAALRASLATPAARERMVKALVEAFIAERDRLPSYEVDTLCTWVVGFGCAS